MERERVQYIKTKQHQNIFFSNMLCIVTLSLCLNYIFYYLFAKDQLLFLFLMNFN